MELSTNDIVDVRNEFSKNGNIDEEIPLETCEESREVETQYCFRQKGITLHLKEKERNYKIRKNQQIEKGKHVLFFRFLTLHKKPNLNSLDVLVDPKLLTYMFMTKSHVPNKEKVWEFFYNVDGAEDGSLNS